MDVLMQIIGILFWFVVILIPLVVIHEFGHLLMSRLVGVRVVEFGVGIPPRVWYKKWKGIIWSINAIWLGGFAKIYGDHDAIDNAHDLNEVNPKEAKEKYITDRLLELVEGKELEFFLEDNNMSYDSNWQGLEKSGVLSGEVAVEDLPKSDQKEYESLYNQLVTLIEWEMDSKINSGEVFYNKNIFQKTLIILGGIIFNLAAAFLIFFVLIGFVSTPTQPILFDDLNEIDDRVLIDSRSENIVLLSVLEDSSAYDAGIRAGDSLVSFSGIELNELQSFDKFKELVELNAGETVPVSYIKKDSGEVVNTDIDLKLNDEGKAVFGVDSRGFGYLVSLKGKNIGSSIGLAAKQTWTVFRLNFEILGEIVKAPFSEDKSALGAVGGPVAVGSVGNQIYSLQGASGILNVMGMVSVSLAAFNLLPLPALDGGRLLIIYLNRLTGRRNKKLEASLIGITFVLLLGLGVVILFKDVIGVVQGKGLF